MLVAERGKDVVSNKVRIFQRLLKVWKSVERSFWFVAITWSGCLHRINPRAAALVPWVSLKEQFGFGYGRMDNFKRVFQTTLRQVHAVYPEARFSFDAKGMRLSNSRPPVATRLLPVR